MNSREIFQLKRIVIVAFLALTAGCSSSEKEEDNFLRIVDNESNTIWLFYPDDNGSFVITGGVEPYSVEYNSELLEIDTDKRPDEWPNTVYYKALGVGETDIEITDVSGQKIVLHATIKYREWKVEIAEHDAFVSGDYMTIAEQNELKEEALATIPVKVGGGYHFIFTEKEAGIVYVYKENSGNKYSEGTFSISYPDDGDENTHRMFHLNFDEEEHSFLEHFVARSRSIGPPIPMGLREDLTDKFKPEYPEAETVYSYQYFYQ